MIIETISYVCTRCQSANIYKNGHNKSGNAQFRCKDYGRSSVLKPKIKYTQEQKELIIQIESGRKHDLTIARKHVKEFLIYPCVMADLAYKGFHQIKSKLLIPIKKSKNISLPKIAKQINKEISRRRIAIEHINCQLKHFRILTERYRNRRKRFGLRVNLITGILN